MGKRVILHIGAPKCGSTYLQRVMVQNQKKLLELSAHYPHSGKGHPGNAQNIQNLTQPWIESQFSKCDVLILSHEDLFACAPYGRRLANLKRKLGFEVQVLCFLRPWAEVLFADYGQTMKQNFANYCATGQAFEGMSFREFVLSRKPFIQADLFLRDWQSLFPDLPLILSPHTAIRKQMTGLHPGFADLDWRIANWLTNPSLSVADCEVVAELIAAGKIDQAEAHWQNMHPTADDPGRSGSRVDWINGLFAAQSQTLKRQYGFAAPT